MPRKVFISFLGTGFYNECVYGELYGERERKADKTRFVQMATLQLIGAQEWSTEDRAFILLTKKARTLNWKPENPKRVNDKTGEEEEYTGLADELSTRGIPTEIIKAVNVEDGKNEEEMWDIFDTIFKLLKDNDSLYIDLTHSFRYLPMLMLVLSNYARQFKNVTIARLSYGNLEAKKDNGVAPIMDLRPLVSLQDWTFALGSFMKYGKIGEFAEDVLSTENREYGKLKQSVDKLSESVQNYEDNMATCRGKLILKGNDFKNFKDSYKKIPKLNLPSPVKKIFEELNDQIDGYEPNNIDNLKKSIIDYCLKYGMTQQALTLSQETIVTIICDKFREEIKSQMGKMRMKDYRDYVSGLLGISEENKSNESKWKGLLAKYRPLSRAFLDLEWFKELRKQYQPLTGLRNTVNHGGFTSEETASDIKDKIKEPINACFEILEGDTPAPTIEASPKPHLFLNVSNHPSKEWGEPQLSAARQYGKICDMPFPPVEPEATEDEIKDLAENLCSEILTLAKENEVTVHIMGEMGLTFCIVERLRGYGIRCLHSTTYRLAETLPDGSKYVRFDFNQFREYTD